MHDRINNCLWRKFVPAFAEHFRVMCVLEVRGIETFPRNFLLRASLNISANLPLKIRFKTIFALIGLIESLSKRLISTFLKYVILLNVTTYLRDYYIKDKGFIVSTNTDDNLSVTS